MGEEIPCVAQQPIRSAEACGRGRSWRASVRAARSTFPEYFGGCWRFFELSNGGFYMSPPDDAYEICIDSNGFHGLMSADAAGIAVCLVSFSQLSFEYATDIFSEHFHQLREFASDHLEAVAIFEAID
jgi:hypothetical protein